MQVRIRAGAVAACVAAAVLTGPAAVASAQGTAKDRYVDRVSVPRIVEHMAAFQHAADVSGGTRSASSPGYVKSRQYVVGKLRAAGYKPTVQRFPYVFTEDLSEFEVVSPTPQTFELFTDFFDPTLSGKGDVTAPVQPVDVVVPPGAAANTSTSGCEPEDFAGFVAGNIALVQRGSCDFAVKANNADAAGAAGLIIMNEGTPGDPSRNNVINPNLVTQRSIPVIGVNAAVGIGLVEAARAGEVVVRIKVDGFTENRVSWNVIADSTLGNPDPSKTIVVGAHLDSVPEGPGINDNGSGSAMVLELARQLHRVGVAPKNRVRFAWWGAEEEGLLGSTYYVSRLSPRALGQIGMNLNFDMVASPNGTLGVYDGDLSDTTSTVPAPPGSDAIEQAFLDAFGDQPTVPSDFSGRSDYRAFQLAGIPAGGLFTGAEVPKTAAEAAIFGGVAGEQLDPCYHEACDTLEHVQTLNGGLGLQLLDANSNAAAAVLWDFAQADELPGATAPATPLGKRTLRGRAGQTAVAERAMR